MGEFRNDHRLPFSDQAVNELIQMASKVQDTFDMAIFTFLHWDEETAKKILLIEEEIDNMEKHCDSIIKRLNEGTCNPGSGVIFLDMLSNFERVGDHSFNIATYVLNIDKNYKNLSQKY